MSQPTPVPDLDSRSGTQASLPRPRGEAPPLLHPEGLPLVSILVAAAVSFVFLVMAPFVVFPVLVELMSEGGDLGPLSLPIHIHNPYLEALIGTLILTIVSLALVLLQRFRPYPHRLPFALSFPVAWALVLPSMLEHGGSWLAWLAFGALIAAAFCLHWQAFQWAREAWD
jgi:hypothetical protein